MQEDPEKSKFLKISEDIRLKSLELDLEHQMYKRELIQHQEITALKMNDEERQTQELLHSKLPELYSIMDFEHQRLKMNLHLVQTRMQGIKPNLLYDIAIPAYAVIFGGILIYLSIVFKNRMDQSLSQIAISTSVSIFVSCVLYAIDFLGNARVRKLELQFLKEKAVEADEFISYLEKEINNASEYDLKISAE